MTIGNMLRVTGVAAGCLAAIASATAPKTHTVDRSIDINSDFDGTWSAVIDVFADRNWAIDKMEKVSGLITTDWMNLGSESSQYADCGGAGLARVVNTQVRFNVRVKDGESPGAPISITVNTSFRQLRTYDGNSATVDCNSTGAVEALIQSEVVRIARKPKPAEKPVEVPAPAAAPAVPVDAGVEVDAQP